MTYWQKLCAEYPDMEKYGAEDKRVKCPSFWGYEKRIRGECLKWKSCADCWSREIPEKKE